MKTSIRAVVLLLATALLGTATFAEIMPLDQVKKGMKGYGMTVFDGATPERFEVEIIGVLRNTGPNQDLILAKVSHEVTDRGGIIAGMSGSPIYLDGKVIGALAYSWQFSKEPIAGITPIEEMLRIGAGKTIPAGAAPAGRVTTAAFLSAMTGHDPAVQMATALQGFTATPASSGGALPVAIPISFSNFAPETVQRFGGYFESRGFMSVPSGTSSGGTTSGTSATFKPGDSIAGVLLSGDFSVAATGTVSHVDGNRVYAFGHPFLDMGEVSFPMATSEVVTVLPNLARSFKMANAGEIVGTFKQDRAAGILGVSGLKELTIPVELTVDTATGPKTYHVQVVRHPQLSPLMIAMAADSIVANTQRAAGQRTVVLDSEISLEGFATIHLQEGWAGNQARESIPSYLALVSSYLLSNEFQDARITGVKLRLRHDDALKIARVTEASIIAPDRGRIGAGDTVKVRALLSPYRGEPFEEVFDLRIPDNQKPGPAYLFVGSGSAMNQVDFTNVPPNPRTLQQVIGVVERLRSSTELTVGLYSASEGAVTAGVYLPDLPPSMGAIIDDDSSNSVRTPVRYYAPEHLSKPMDYIVDGWVRVDLNVRPKV